MAFGNTELTLRPIKNMAKYNLEKLQITPPINFNICFIRLKRKLFIFAMLIRDNPCFSTQFLGNSYLGKKLRDTGVSQGKVIG